MTDESLIREVDEEVRQDEYKKLWDRYGTLITGAIVLVVGAVGAYEGYKYYNKSQSEAASVVYMEAVKKAQDGKHEDALAALAAVKHVGFGQLAKLREAAVLGEKGDIDKAVATYDTLAANSGTEPALADLARIRAGYLLVDKATPDELLTKLGKFDRDDSAWRFAAREIFGLSAFRIKDFVMADRYMNAIYADPEAPTALKQRAQVMIQLIAPDLPKK